ncbi:LysM peptidoglycan-binding domain-containing protein [Piscinibacter sp.]|uniref:LysM peptidoglycan-binding domain-containing protein n=1 Tax=Piscinibacter sp. TaxID=1903157 RepID=UPI002C924EA2|nr:LysM peptidoglycan-binding domain-containing protein [Albitalea sp.]HUG23535.1 LysM peptidoglycan-binding domain-containing protein [Albitalea sp.]
MGSVSTISGPIAATRSDSDVSSQQVHVVERGDTLGSIAARNRTSVAALLAANPQVRNAHLIYPGDRIAIPATDSKPAPETTASAGVETVQRGDTLREMARSHQLSFSALVAANPQLRDVNLIRIGERINIPNPAHGTAATGAAPVQSAAASGPATAITADQLARIMPAADAERWVGPLNAAMAAHGIHTPQQQAAFLGQIGVESGQLRTVSENLNYSAQRLTQVWPKRFPTLESAQPYAHNPQALANHVYANRNGNGNEASGDGWKYRGGGLMQTTGRANYRAAGFEDNPQALREDATAADSAGRFWQDNGLNARTDSSLSRSDYNGITRTVSGGLNHAQERWDLYQRALDVLTR